MTGRRRQILMGRWGRVVLSVSLTVHPHRITIDFDEGELSSSSNGHILTSTKYQSSSLSMNDELLNQYHTGKK